MFTLPLLIGFHRPKNLRDLLVRAVLKPPLQMLPGNYQCGAAKCKTCLTLLAVNEFSSHSTGEKFLVRVRASCTAVKSSNVMYLIICRRYGKHCVGETGQELHCRLNNHCYDIVHRRTEDSPVAERLVYVPFFCCLAANL